MADTRALLDQAEHVRITTATSINPNNQTRNGQYFTPAPVARIMANLPKLPTKGTIRILDAGAGTGILAAAVIEHLRETLPDMRIVATAVEFDGTLIDALRNTLNSCTTNEVETHIINTDFLTWALTTNQRFDLVIQNPPYAKLAACSAENHLLHASGIKVPNVYAAFMLLGARLLVPGGQQVSITPRSWMNGTYFRHFRHDFCALMSIDAVHTFESRSKVFHDSSVLQEAVIVCATRADQAAEVKLQISKDSTDAPRTRTVPAAHVVSNDFIYVPATGEDGKAVEWMKQNATHSLADLGLHISTGKVVDFCMREHLFTDPPAGSYPMVYSVHFSAGEITHPRVELTKPQWFLGPEEACRKNLVLAGTYVLVKCFSTKEEKRRIVAAVWNGGVPAAFDNKLNYFHAGGKGLDAELAHGLAAWLNSPQVDAFFRVFSGHTQVNAGDLRTMNYPSLGRLRELGGEDRRRKQIMLSHNL